MRKSIVVEFNLINTRNLKQKVRAIKQPENVQ